MLSTRPRPVAFPLARGVLVAALAAGLLGLALSARTPTPAHAATVNCTVNTAELPPDQEEQNLLNLINRYRTQPYAWSSTLSGAAR